jgi:hypothetical protein
MAYIEVWIVHIGNNSKHIWQILNSKNQSRNICVEK